MKQLYKITKKTTAIILAILLIGIPSIMASEVSEYDTYIATPSVQSTSKLNDLSYKIIGYVDLLKLEEVMESRKNNPSKIRRNLMCTSAANIVCTEN